MNSKVLMLVGIIQEEVASTYEFDFSAAVEQVNNRLFMGNPDSLLMCNVDALLSRIEE